MKMHPMVSSILIGKNIIYKTKHLLFKNLSLICQFFFFFFKLIRDIFLGISSPLPFMELFEENETPPKQNKLGRCIVDLDHLLKSFQDLAIPHRGFGCTLADMEVIKQHRNGLQLCFTLKCKMCMIEKKIDTNKKDEMSLNEAALTGVIATGNGFSQMEEFFAAMNMKSMTKKTYKKHHDRIADVMEKACLEEIMQAGLEEKKMAESEKSFTPDGRPAIPVIVDGSWPKRSYRTKYDSSSGMVK